MITCNNFQIEVIALYVKTQKSSTKYSTITGHPLTTITIFFMILLYTIFKLSILDSMRKRFYQQRVMYPMFQGLSGVMTFTVYY